MDNIVNKVASSGLVVLDLGDYYLPGRRSELDIADQLFQGLILREKDFRAYVKETNWSKYEGEVVNICCSADAIIPEWAYMLLVTAIEPFALFVGFGTGSEVDGLLFSVQLSKLNVEEFTDQRVVIKGCGEKPVPSSAYVEVVRVLRPHVKSIMFGEPCSTVPVYKKKQVSK